MSVARLGCWLLTGAAFVVEEDMMHAYMRYCNAEPRSEAG